MCRKGPSALNLMSRSPNLCRRTSFSFWKSLWLRNLKKILNSFKWERIRWGGKWTGENEQFFGKKSRKTSESRNINVVYAQTSLNCWSWRYFFTKITYICFHVNISGSMIKYIDPLLINSPKTLCKTQWFCSPFPNFGLRVQVNAIIASLNFSEKFIRLL